MSEFTQLIKEAFVGEEPFRPELGAQQVHEAIQQYERRMKTARWLAWFSVTFMTVVWVASLLWILRGEMGSKAEEWIAGSIFVWSFVSIGFMKMWLFAVQNHYSAMKEIKRIQLLLLRDRDDAS